jgi:chromosome segregation ATPase
MGLDALESRFYIRITVADQPGVLAQIARSLGDHGVSIAAVNQKEADADARTAELVVMTHRAREGAMQAALAEIGALPVVVQVSSFLRVEGEQQVQALGEILTWLEQQLRATREEQAKANALLDQLRRQVYETADQVSQAERALREVDPKFLPFKGVPDKIRALDESTEQLRHAITTNRADFDNALRILRAEAEADRSHRGEVFKQIELATHQLGLVIADVAQVQAQASQVAQTAQSLLERQREVEARVEQFGLRLDRSIEVHKDLEDRIRNAVFADQDDRFDVVFERLQVVGEMVKRNEDLIRAATAEQTLREEVLDQIRVWRDEHTRVDLRLNALEEVTDKFIGQLDRLHGEVVLLEGRHQGLGERVAGIRQEIAEVVDHVRGEFAKYNQMTEKQRRKQIQVLEQELREMKFHAFRPPEEP